MTDYADWARDRELSRKNKIKINIKEFSMVKKAKKKPVEELKENVIENWCRNKDDYCPHLKELEEENEQLRKRIEKYKKDLKELRVAFIQVQAMALNGGISFEEIIGQMEDITFGVSN